MNEIYESLIAFLDQYVDTYLTENLPDDVQFPRATFDISINDWDSVSIMTLNIWDKGTDPTKAMNIAQSIIDAVGTGLYFQSDSYGFVIHKGSPLCQRIPTDDNTVHLYLVFSVYIVNR